MASDNHKINKRTFVRTCLAFSAGIVSCPAGLASNSFIDQPAGRYPAMYQEETPRGIMCRICPNECVLKEGELSQCNNRRVIKSKLYTLAYGNPCSVNIDPVEKKPLYHFFPGSRAYSIATAGCNLVCLNCQNWTISQTSPDKTSNYTMLPRKVVDEAEKSRCKSIAYTYSEPVTFYEYTVDTSKLARESGIKNIVKSNGYINPEPLSNLCKYTDAANIDLKSFNESTYLRLTGGKLQPVLESLKQYLDSEVWLEITCLIVPGWSDNPEEIARMCKWLTTNGFSRTPLHLSRFYPVHKLDKLPPTPTDLMKKAYDIAVSEGMKYVYTGNMPGNEMSDTKCPSCGNVVVGRKGYSITVNNLTNGKCGKCGTVVDGIWN